MQLRRVLWISALNGSMALAVMVESAFQDHTLAAVSSAPADLVGDQLRDQLNKIANTPVDFCDPKIEQAHFYAFMMATGNLTLHQLKIHPPGPDSVKAGIDKVVQDVKADGGLVEDLPYMADYEDAEDKGDVEAQKKYLKMMTPAARAQAAEHDQDYILAAKILTPLADTGDVNAQLRLADIYSFGTEWPSPQNLPTVPAKLLPSLGPHWPPVTPPDNLPLAFKYYQSAAAKGNFFGQSELARAYACGFGTQKNLTLAYMWFSLGLSQRGVTTEMSGATLESKGSQKEYALDRDFIIAQMKPEEIGHAKSLMTQCLTSNYKDCNSA